MATTEERLEDLAKIFKGYKPRQTHWAMYVDELLLRAVNEMKVLKDIIVRMNTDPVLRAMVDALQELERQNRSKEVDAGVPTEQIINLRNAISAYSAMTQGRCTCGTSKS